MWTVNFWWWKVICCNNKRHPSQAFLRCYDSVVFYLFGFCWMQTLDVTGWRSETHSSRNIFLFLPFCFHWNSLSCVFSSTSFLSRQFSVSLLFLFTCGVSLSDCLSFWLVSVLIGLRFSPADISRDWRGGGGWHWESSHHPPPHTPYFIRPHLQYN